MNIRFGILVLLTALATGCAETRNYVISIHNQTAQPLVVGQVKRGEPFEEIWASPEQVAYLASANKERAWGVTVPPGKSAEAPLTGKFDPHATAWLYIYRGDPSLSEILATNLTNPGRLNLLLDPGRNEYIITQRNGQLHAERVTTPPPQP
jgi:hypothetical protein